MATKDLHYFQKNIPLDEKYASLEKWTSCKDGWCLWVNSISAIMISPLIMMLESSFPGGLLASLFMVVLTMRFQFIKASSLLAVTCCWLWILQTVVPEAIMIDGLTQLKLIGIMLVTMVVIKAIQVVKSPILRATNESQHNRNVSRTF